MEQRLNKLEEFQKKWRFYFWSSVVLMGLLGAFFGWKIHDLHKVLDDMSDEKNKLIHELKIIRKKAIEAESISKNAYLIAGNLQTAVNEAKKASHNAENKSSEVAKMHKDILQKVNEIKKISQEASAIAKVVESRLRQSEIILAKIKKSKLKKQPKNALKKMTVNIEGSFMMIKFIEGPNPFNNIKINQSSYRGNVYIPKGYSAKVEGNTRGSFFIVSQELKGRVINSTTGFFNKWMQDSSEQTYYFPL